jgi:hypothetical protein
MSGELRPLGAIDPDAQHVEFRSNQCRDCGAAGPVLLVDNGDWFRWFDVHSRETGHKRFYQYKIERSTGEVHAMPRPGRRPLGQR